VGWDPLAKRRGNASFAAPGGNTRTAVSSPPLHTLKGHETPREVLPIERSAARKLGQAVKED